MDLLVWHFIIILLRSIMKSDRTSRLVHLWIAYIAGIFGAEFLLDGYVASGHPEIFVKSGVQCTAQRFDGKHKNEFLVRYPNGSMCLYENNVLKQQWQENGNEQISNEFVTYKNGRVDFRQSYQYIWE